MFLAAFETAWAERRIREKKTVAHECLERELRASAAPASVGRKAKAELTSVIHAVSAALPSRLNSADIKTARNTLATIDQVLAKRGYYLAMPTPSLLKTLLPCPPPRSDRQLLTPQRKDAFREKSGKEFHQMDCDTGAILYAGIGEALKLPIVVVEVPGHKFVRWRLSGQRSINWDTNAAREYSDSDFRRGRTLTYRHTMTRTEEAAGKFLTDLSRDDLLAYHRNVTADLCQERRAFTMAANEYQAALDVRSHDSLAANNLAWLLLDQSSLRNADSVRVALTLAKRATSILPRNRDYQDTLARAFAANGRFKEAIAAERRAYDKRSHIRLFKSGKAY